MAEIPINDLRSQLPSNSYSQQPKEKAQLEKIATGTRKKSIGRKFADVFLGADVKDIKQFLIWDCLVPGVKYAMLDSLLMLFGERGYRGGGGPGSRVPMNTSRVNYNGLTSLGRGAPVERRDAQVMSNRYSMDDVIFETKAEAEEVIDALIERIADYGEATVHDLYDLAGVGGANFTDNYWGWRDLSMCRSKPVRDGWVILFPRVESLR